jgi:hypothetical protein
MQNINLLLAMLSVLPLDICADDDSVMSCPISVLHVLLCTGAC